MPQLSQLMLVYQSQWFWLLLVLAAIYFVGGRWIVPKVEATVDERDAQIAADLAEAERLRAEADASEEAWRIRMNEAHEAAYRWRSRRLRNVSPPPTSASPRRPTRPRKPSTRRAPARSPRSRAWPPKRRRASSPS
jgi:hypothetical protein